MSRQLHLRVEVPAPLDRRFSASERHVTEATRERIHQVSENYFSQ